MRVRVRLFAIQRELAGRARSSWSCRPARRSRTPGRRSSRCHPALAPGRAVRAVRPERRLRRRRHDPGRRRRARDHPAGERRGGRSATRARRRNPDPRAARRAVRNGRSSASSATGSRPTRTARSSGSSAGPASRRARRRPARRRRRRDTPAASVESLGYEAHEPMALAILERIADEIAERFGVERIAIVHRTGDVPLGEASVAVVAVVAASRRRVRRRPVRDRRDEGARADLEGRALRRRPRLGRRAGPRPGPPSSTGERATSDEEGR